MVSPPSILLPIPESFVQNKVHEAPGVLPGLLKFVELSHLQEDRTSRALQTPFWEENPITGPGLAASLASVHMQNHRSRGDPVPRPCTRQCCSHQHVLPLPHVGTHPLTARSLLGNPPQLRSLIITAFATANTQPSQCIKPFSGYLPF